MSVSVKKCAEEHDRERCFSLNGISTFWLCATSSYQFLSFCYYFMPILLILISIFDLNICHFDVNSYAFFVLNLFEFH
jgi:hypothetical protein